MFTREYYLKEIIEYWALVQVKIQMHSVARYLDPNITAEYFVRDVLNLVLKTNFQNANAVLQDNFPGIDLADTVNGIAVQVTSDVSLRKVRHTLDAFVRHNLNTRFSRLIIFMLQQRQKSYKVTAPQPVNFDPARDIWDFTRLYKEVAKLESTERIRELADYSANAVKVPQRDNESRDRLNSLLTLFERQVFSAPLDREDPVEMFRAIHEVRITLQKSDAVLLLDKHLVVAIRRVQEVLAQCEHDVQMTYPAVYQAAKRRPAEAMASSTNDPGYWEAVRMMMAIRPHIEAQLDIAHRELDQLK